MIKKFKHMFSIKNSLKFFSAEFVKMDIWQRLLLVFCSIFFSILFIENFAFSSSFATLHLREVDDLAFQASIRNFHESVSAFRPDRFFKLNDYGYGWIFWIISGVITYPFYLFALVTDCYAPLIIVPRDISLAFTIGTAFFVYKSLSIYSKNEFLKLIALLFLFSFPAFGQFATRFGTVSQVMFFSALTFYLTIRKEVYEKRDLRHIAFAAAACVGTKLNGALILPLIGLILADRMKWSITKENLQKAKYFLINFIPVTIFFSNPSLFLSPFKPSYFTSYIDSLKNNSHLSLQDNFLQTLRDVLEAGYLNFYLAIIAVIFLLMNFLNKKEGRKGNDLLFMGLWLTFSLLLLVKIMSMGTLYIINYATVMMYLLVFFVIYLERWKKAGNLVALMLLIISVSLNYKNIHSGFYSDFKYFHLKKDHEVIAKLEASGKIKKLIADPKENSDKKITVLMDFRAIFPYAHLERENVNVQFAFDNLQVIQKQIEGDFDYISLGKAAPFFLSDEKFSEHLKSFKEEMLISNQVESRKIVQNLMKTGRVGNAEYEILLNSNDIIFFGKKS